MFWHRKKNPPRPPFGKIEIFSRQCLYSTISSKKKRPEGFSRELCFRNLLSTIDRNEANVTIFLDRAGQTLEGHFLNKYDSDPIISVQQGSEAGAFLALLESISNLPLHPDTLLYVVEDDYLHRPGWIPILKEAFSTLPVDYATLYDHRDKYDLSLYPKLIAQVFAAKSCHWRTTPSTTQTFAVRFGTLLEDLKIHRRFSRNRSISADHQKFLALGRKGRVLVSALPGFSTHLDPKALSPCVDWNDFLK